MSLNNRIPFFGGKKPPQLTPEQMQEKTKQLKEAVLVLSAQLSTLIPPGMNVVVYVPVRGIIITPDKPQQYTTMIISHCGVFDIIKGEI